MNDTGQLEDAPYLDASPQRVEILRRGQADKVGHARAHGVRQRTSLCVDELPTDSTWHPPPAPCCTSDCSGIAQGIHASG